MILNSCNLVFSWRNHQMRTLCCASKPIGTNSNQIREQLDQLHKEADTTRKKAQSSRLRLMRLSEAAEKLRRQAVVSVRNRNENDARELLFQKKKVMQAIEKSKDRVELLDELAAKLYEAISLKETQLIANIAKDLEIGSKDMSVRIVSPTEEDTENIVLKEEEHPNLDCDDVQQKLQVAVLRQGNLDVPDELINGQVLNKVNLVQGPKDTSSFESFLEHLDLQLSRIEAELVTFLNSSTLHPGDKEMLEITKVQESLEILHSIRQIRARIGRNQRPMQTSDEDLS